TIAGLAYRSLSLIQNFDVQFDKENLLLVAVNPTLIAPRREVNLELLESIRNRLAVTPGVASVSYVRFPAQVNLPPQLIHAADSDRTDRASLNYVGPDYLKSLRLAASAGRDISVSDRLRANKVVVVSQSLAEALWPGQSPIGQRISIASNIQPLSP